MMWPAPGPGRKPAGGGSATPVLIAHTGAALGASGGTTSAINTTGANLIVINVSWYNNSALAVSDSKSNTWTALTKHADTPAAGTQQMFYCLSPTVGTGHTFTENGDYSSIAVEAWSNITGLDLQGGGNTGGVGYPPGGSGGTVTPSQPNTLVIAAQGWYDTLAGQTITIDSGFTIADDIGAVGSVNTGNLIAYKILTAASAQSPTWTISTFAATAGFGITSFKY